MDQVEAVEVKVFSPDAGRGQGIDWARSLTFATGDYSRHFKFEQRNLKSNSKSNYRCRG